MEDFFLSVTMGQGAAMCLKALKFAIWLGCLALFSVQSYSVFRKYREGATTVTTSQMVNCCSSYLSRTLVITYLGEQILAHVQCFVDVLKV